MNARSAGVTVNPLPTGPTAALATVPAPEPITTFVNQPKHRRTERDDLDPRLTYPTWIDSLSTILVTPEHPPRVKPRSNPRPDSRSRPLQ